jgi:predicted GTPase
MKTKGVEKKSKTGVAASRRLGRELVDLRPYAVGSLKEIYENYPHISRVLPALGYSEAQIRDLEETIQRRACDTVVIVTPMDLRRKIRIDQPAVRVNDDFDVDLRPLIDRFVDEILRFS